jgi:hypothetical protein
MKVIYTVLTAFTLGACGKEVRFDRVTKADECDKVQSLANCRTGTAAPTPTPVPTVGLVFQGDVPSPPPSGYTLQGHVRVLSGTPNTWQTLGFNNQTPVTATVGTTMTQAGQCRNVDVKIVVTNGGPNSGTFYYTTNGNKFRVCEENGKVVVEFEDGVDTLFNDYRVEISSTTSQPLRYQIVGGWLQVCLD